MTLSRDDTTSLLEAREHNTGTRRLSGAKYCSSDDDEHWIRFLEALDADSEFTSIADVARKWRSAGMPLRKFLKAMIASFEVCDQSDKLDEVFDFSEFDGWDIEPEAIEAALSRIKEGASAAEAYEHAKSIAGRTDGSKPH